MILNEMPLTVWLAVKIPGYQAGDNPTEGNFTICKRYWPLSAFRIMPRFTVANHRSKSPLNRGTSQFNPD